MPLGVVHLDRPEQVAAETDRVDHEAPDLIHRGGDARIGPGVLDHDTWFDAIASARNGAAPLGGSPRPGRPSAPR